MLQIQCCNFLEKVCFVYIDFNLEAVLDRLPTSRVVGHDARGYPIAEAEVFSRNGLDMWLKSQGDLVELEKNTDQKESDACSQSGHGVQ